MAGVCYVAHIIASAWSFLPTTSIYRMLLIQGLQTLTFTLISPSFKYLDLLLPAPFMRRLPRIYSFIHPATHGLGTANTEVTKTDTVTTFMGPMAWGGRQTFNKRAST